jgi:hypothetical protein
MSRPIHPRNAWLRALLLAAALCGAIAVWTMGPSEAQADAGMYTFRLDFGKHPRLLPTLHAKQNLDAAEEDREYDYTAKGYFKIATKTVARLPQFSGHATQALKPISLKVKASTRHTIRAVARRHHGKHVTLTIVYRLTLTKTFPGDTRPQHPTDTQDVLLALS